MATNYKKKAEEAYDAQAQGIINANQQNVDAVNKANAQREQALNAAQQLYQQRVDSGYKQFADIIAGEKARADVAQQEALAQQEAERKAARWTGAGELAASVANLVSVGAGNAVSQQYHTYSQDWMKRADENWRANRARIDNLRERQRALQQQITQMKMGDAATALSLAGRRADAAYQHGAATAQAGYQAAREAGAARTQGVMAGINLGLSEAQLAETKRARQENAALQAAHYGLIRNKDGTYVLDNTSPVTKASLRASSGNSGASKNTLYYYDDENNLVPVFMTTKEYDEFVNQSYAFLKDYPEFKKAYQRAGTDAERKSLIYQYAIQDPARRAVLSQYSAHPETEKKEEVKKEKPQGSVGSASDFDNWANQNPD